MMINPFMNNAHTFTNPRRQAFSLPYGFTNHIFKNYTPQVYWKLAMSCKQFFGQKRIIVAKSFIYFHNVDGNPIIKIDGERYDIMELEHIKLWILQKIYFEGPNK